jgi:hypothetical protein
VIIATIATIGPNPGVPVGVEVGVAVSVGVGVAVGVAVSVGVGVAAGVAVGVGVGAAAVGAETTKIENPGVSARSVTSSESLLTTSVESG